MIKKETARTVRDFAIESYERSPCKNRARLVFWLADEIVKRQTKAEWAEWIEEPEKP